MLVEFEIIKDCEIEHKKNEIQKDLYGILNRCLYNEKDYICKIAIDVDRVVDFSQSISYFNDEKKESTKVFYVDGEMEILLISFNNFKKIYEFVKKTKIETAKDILIKMRYEIN